MTEEAFRVSYYCAINYDASYPGKISYGRYQFVCERLGGDGLPCIHALTPCSDAGDLTLKYEVALRIPAWSDSRNRAAAALLKPASSDSSNCATEVVGGSAAVKVAGVWAWDQTNTARTWTEGNDPPTETWQHRRYVDYDAALQECLNDAWLRGLELVDASIPSAHGPLQATFNLKTFCQTVHWYRKRRAMQLTFAGGVISHDTLFAPESGEGVKERRDLRSYFGKDETRAYLYCWENQQKLDVEYADPAAVIPGDTKADARDRAVLNGVCLAACVFSVENQCFVWSAQKMKKLNITTKDRVTLRRVDTAAEEKLIEYNIDELDPRTRSIKLSADLDMESGGPLPEDMEEGLWRIDAVHDWLTLRFLKDSLYTFATTDTPFRQLLIDDMEDSTREIINKIDIPSEQWKELERTARSMPLNESQFHAIMHAFQHRLGLVQGPPGTGKTFFTEVLLRLLCHFSDAGKKTLLAAPSNVGVDNAAQRLIQDEHKLSDVLASKGSPGQSFVLRRYGRKLALQYEKVVRAIHMDTMCRTIDGFDEKAFAQEVEGASVLCGTQGSLFIRKVISSQNYGSGALEENGLSPEVEALGALNLLSRCTLVGDHHQNKRPLKSSRLQGSDFNRSLLERCAGRAGPGTGFEMVTLATNYRSHPEVFRFSSMTWYEDKMLPGKAPEDFPPIPGIYWPQRGWQRTVFVHVEGMEAKVEGGSIGNAEERKVVRFILQDVFALNKWDTEELVNEKVGVISPYAGQCDLLRSEIREETGRNITTSTVDSFQGSERDVIVASTVRSGNTLGFLTDFRKLNVLLTRARAGTVVVGNARTLQRDGVWSKLLSFLHERSCVLSVTPRSTHRGLQWNKLELAELYPDTQVRASAGGALRGSSDALRGEGAAQENKGSASQWEDAWYGAPWQSNQPLETGDSGTDVGVKRVCDWTGTGPEEEQGEDQWSNGWCGEQWRDKPEGGDEWEDNQQGRGWGDSSQKGWQNNTMDADSQAAPARKPCDISGDGVFDRFAKERSKREIRCDSCGDSFKGQDKGDFVDDECRLNVG
jgi:hypothetical protein